MEWFDSHVLTTIVFLPVALGVLGLLIPSGSETGKTAIKVWTLLTTLITLGVSFLAYRGYAPSGAEFQFIEKTEWVPAFGISYSLGIDGISLWLVLLTTTLMPIAVLGSFKGIEDRIKEYYFLLLLLESGMLGAFVALDVFLFYVFWESMLIPMYFLIGIWGANERVYAAMKFFLYTLVGSLLMLVAIFYLAYQYKHQFGVYSMGITDLYKLQLPGDGFWSTQSILFLAFALAFAVKVPLFPLHTWLPDAHVQAPTAGSVILAAILLKMGGYGFMRLAFPLFPQAVSLFQVPFMILGAVAVVYGACVAMVQPDMKKLVAYSSVSHMGYVVFGLFTLNSLSVTGAYYQMLNHGVSTGALFLIVGMIYERRHTKMISEFGGIARAMPLFAVAFMIFTLSSIALPGTNGFIGEFMILLGAWAVNPGLTVIAALGTIFGAVYMLWMFERVMFGQINKKENSVLHDLSFRELIALIPLIVAVFVMGIYPNFVFDKLNQSVDRFLVRSTRSTVVTEYATNPAATHVIQAMTKQDKGIY
ncbi:MAG: NADH-quinone oxidoreductase subunit M [Bdellovibrionota bacterium]